jgi:DNA-binding transcriptional LysR family regulator
MFQLRQLRTFVAAAETLSFTRAAERVHLTQPSVTEQIRALEDAVGRPLFARQRNALALTDAGGKLLTRARELLAMADDTLHAVKGDAAATAASLTLVAPETLTLTVFTPVMADYAQRYPNVSLTLLTRNSTDTLSTVKDGSADLGLLHGLPAHTASLTSEILSRDEPVLVVPSGNPLSRRQSVSIHDFAEERLGATTPGCSYRAYLDALLPSDRDMPGISFEAESVRSLIGMVAAGLGVCVLPRLAFRSALPGAGVRAVRLDGAIRDLPVCLVRPARTHRREPLHVSAFVGMLRARIPGLDQAMPTVDMQHGPRGVAVTQQEDHGVGDVLGCADTPHR